MKGWTRLIAVTVALSIAGPALGQESKLKKADKMWAAHQGARGYVTKPYTQDQILEQLRRYL